jgi:sugar phosphate isomerase/epimerase
MLISHAPPIHLTYCLNVHPGETLADHRRAIDEFATPIGRAVAGDAPFALGLRFGATATAELAEPAALDALKQQLNLANTYAMTVNGFPYGAFHNQRVKTDVYLPDWSTDARREYTIQLANTLAALLPAGQRGTISTVPLAFKTADAPLEAMVQQLAATLLALAEIERRTGKQVQLALEPEPGCLLETTDEVIAFFTGPLARACPAELLPRHLGVCFDTSHQAVEFEDLAESVDALTDAGVSIAKVQLSSAAKFLPATMDRAALAPLVDDVYLHQTSILQADGAVERFVDLPDAMASDAPGVEWRVHYHMPLFADRLGELATTRDLLTGRFAQQLAGGLCDQVEVETYTWSLLPGGTDPQSLTENLIRELRWARELIRAAGA